MIDLTKAQRHEIYKLARKLFTDTWTTNKQYRYHGMCLAIRHAIIYTLPEEITSVYDLEDYNLPEFKALDEFPWGYKQYWWAEQDRDIREHKFDILINQTQP